MDNQSSAKHDCNTVDEQLEFIIVTSACNNENTKVLE